MPPAGKSKRRAASLSRTRSATPQLAPQVAGSARQPVREYEQLSGPDGLAQGGAGGDVGEERQPDKARGTVSSDPAVSGTGRHGQAGQQVILTPSAGPSRLAAASSRPAKAFSPSLQNRLPPLPPSQTRSSSETDITYADAPRDSDADVTTRFALEGQARRAHEAEEAAAAAAPAPRAPSLAGTSVSKAWSQRKKNCAFGPGGWQWREGTKLPHPDDPPAGYPPSVFALQPPSSSPQSHHQPLPEHSPPISRSNLLLEPFLTADRAVKQDLGPGFRKLSRTKSRVEEWRDEVAGRTSVDAEERDYEGQEEYGGGEEEEEDEMVSGEMEQDENELPSPSDAHKKPLKPSQNAAASPSSPVASSTPLKRPRPPLPAPSPFPNLSSPPSRALSSPNLNTGSSPKKVYKTKDIVKLLPKRRRRVVGKALRERQVRVPQADSSAEEEEEDDDEGEEEEGSEAETDYELFSAPHHCRPAARTKSSQGKSSKKKASTYSSKQTKKRTVPSSGRKGTKSRRRKTDENEEEEEDSETERRKEAARRKWAAVDGYQLETVRTLY